MDYRIEIRDEHGCFKAAIQNTPLFEIRTTSFGCVSARGLLPVDVPALEAMAPGWRVCLFMDGKNVGEAGIVRVNHQWSDTRKLVLDRYVSFHHICEIEAESRADYESKWVSAAYENRPVSEIVRDLVQRAAGPVHCAVEHGTYPAGAQREYRKFAERRSESNELSPGAITSGDWIGPERIDARNAGARDGDTISGLVVDGEAWPDVRLLMVDAEETTRNSHAVKRHPEVADWSPEHYHASPYRIRAERARDALQGLMDTHGIQYLELSPYRGANGEFDNRVDAYGRVLAMVYGGGECFNAALVEKGVADVYLYDEGGRNPPEWTLKDYFSYVRTSSADSVSDCDRIVRAFDYEGPLGEALAQLACLQGGIAWHVAPDGRLSFKAADTPDRILFHDPLFGGVALAQASTGMVNALSVEGAPYSIAPALHRERQDSRVAYGERHAAVQLYSLSHTEDMAAFAEGALDDLAVPARCGWFELYRGDALAKPGMQVEIRSAGISTRVRVQSVEHYIRGNRVSTHMELGPPLRSVENPLAYMVRAQSSPDSYYTLRLDEIRAGLDAEFHLA